MRLLNLINNKALTRYILPGSIVATSVAGYSLYNIISNSNNDLENKTKCF